MKITQLNERSAQFLLYLLRVWGSFFAKCAHVATTFNAFIGTTRFTINQQTKPSKKI